MTAGFAEEAATSVLIYQCGFFGNPGYTTYKEAITDLALDLYNKYYDLRLSVYKFRYSSRIKDCCRKELIAAKKACFCNTCNQEIVDEPFVEDEFMDYIRKLHNTTCDTYGEAESTSRRDMTWWPWWTNDFIGASKDEIIHIPENAEQVLCAALLEAKPELATNDPDWDFSDTDWNGFKIK